MCNVCYFGVGISAVPYICELQVAKPKGAIPENGKPPLIPKIIS